MRHVPGLVVLVALFLFLATRNVPSEPFGYDEADYMFAASRGLAANYLDSPTLPIGDFLRQGLQRGSAAGERRSLSESIRRGNDMVFYRHWHGPMYHFLLVPVSRLGLDEASVRRAMLAIPAVTIIVIYAGCVWLIPGVAGMFAGLFSAALFAAGFTSVHSRELAPHQLFALWSVCFVCALAKLSSGGERRHWYLAVVFAGLAFCTMEVAFVMILTLAICVWVERARLNIDRPMLLRSAALWVVTVLVAWPAGILKLSFLKAYFFMAYLALVRKAPWGEESFLDTWRERFTSSPLEWAAIALALAVVIRAGRRSGEMKLAYPILIYGGLMIAATLRVLTGAPRYSLPFLPALDLFAGLTLIPYAAKLSRKAMLTASAGFAILYGLTVWQVRPRPATEDPRPPAVLAWIRDNHLEHASLLVPQNDLPMIHYYYPDTALRGYYGDRTTPADLQGFSPQAVLLPGYPLRFSREKD